MAGYGNNIMFYQMLLRNGVPPQAAMGALTSLMGESGQYLDPTSHNANDPGASGSVGMGQWNRERLDALKSFAARKGTSYLDPSTQVGFIEQELNGSHSNVLAKLRQAGDLRSGASIWTNSYEMPAVDNTAQRIAGNLDVVNKIGLGETGVAPYAGSGEFASIEPMGAGGLGTRPAVGAGLMEMAATPEQRLTTGIADTLADAVSTDGSAPRSRSMLGGSGTSGLAELQAKQAFDQTVAQVGATPAAPKPEELSARYDTTKQRGGVLADAQLGDLFKVKEGIGQARQQPRVLRRIS